MYNVCYITGLSGSGKTTIALELQKSIPNSVVLDGDVIRKDLNKDLGFTREDKVENIRRNNALIKLLSEQGLFVICAFMASISEEREKLFELCPNTLKVQLTTSIEECIRRDTKGYYSNPRDNFAGITSKYEPLHNPDISLNTELLSLESCINIIRDCIS